MVDLPPLPKVTALILHPERPLFLAHSFVDSPALPLRLPGGSIDGDERAEAALHREIAEETGLRGLLLLRPLGVQRYFKAYLGRRVVRHDFLLRAPAGTPEGWRQRVGGSGEDAGALFAFHRLAPAERHRLDPEHQALIDPVRIPELAGP